ncbi:pyrroline-5-carboxylate reductase family protein [Neotabrizicola sp. sgz301269]|uniref:pyrroline-5-carboxylate reductase family protein n=1 Tax=Neotabrizicola sp. sgz301269 TaxID=3276282 RepID=UPI00376FBE29
MGRIGIVGATGWLGQALGLNLLRRGVLPASDLVLLRRSGEGTAYSAFPGVVWASDASELCGLCDTLVLSVRPNDFPIPGLTPRNHLLISFMAAWSLDALQDLAPDARVVRAMPNSGAPTGMSYTPWVAGMRVTANDRALTARLLGAMGQEEALESEDQLHYLSALSGSGAAYPALMARAMLADAIAFGLSPEIARRAVESVICGSGEILRENLASLDDLLATYMSYKGITAAGLSAAQEAGFETAVHAALAAAFAKARTMRP